MYWRITPEKEKEDSRIGQRKFPDSDADLAISPSVQPGAQRLPLEDSRAGHK
jgi:hypothetical protein